MCTVMRTPTSSTRACSCWMDPSHWVFGKDRVSYGPGDSCSIPAGTMHEEHTEADGMRYVSGRRSVSRQDAAR